jgi:hypothetical protein
MVNIRMAYFAAAALALSATAAPTPNAHTASLSRRQDAQTPSTIQTQDITKVSGGTIVRDCTVVFEDLDPNSVRKTEKCTELFVPEGQPLPPAPSNTAQPPVASPDPVPPTNPAPPPTDTTIAPADTTTLPANPAPTSSPAEGGNDPQQPGDTSSPPASEPTQNPDAPGDNQPTQPAGGEQDSSTGGEGAPTDSPAGGVVTSSDGAASPSPTAPSEGGSTVTGTRAGAEASQSAGQVNVPGKSVEVLPIGLGVFAGISVIALIVVGLTTYERTKYRKAFRARRLAASGAEMGYGGMSERR